jgi:serine protease Do
MIDEVLLIQLIEKYLANEMSAEEKFSFEQLRKSTPQVDQKVVEHSMFLQQIGSFSERTNFKSILDNIHHQLADEGKIETLTRPNNKKGKLVYLFNKYKRVTAIAAAVGGAIALMTSVVVSKYTTVSSEDVIKLAGAVQQQQNQIADLKNEIKKSKIPTTAEVKGWGSSFLIDGSGYLITNAHVLEGANSATVYNEAGKEFNASIAYINPKIDLAVLKIEDQEFVALKKLPYGIKKNTADLGEEIYTIGFPNFPRTDVVYNIGYLSSVKGYNGDTLAYQIQMNANRGNSGGAIFNKKGEVVGILSTKLSKADGVSFAVKSKGIYSIVDELKQSDTLSNIKISTTNSLASVDRVGQIKQLENYVYLVKAYKK